LTIILYCVPQAATTTIDLLIMPPEKNRCFAQDCPGVLIYKNVNAFPLSTELHLDFSTPGDFKECLLLLTALSSTLQPCSVLYTMPALGFPFSAEYLPILVLNSSL